MTEENIKEKSVGKIVFHNTNYLALTNGRHWAIAKVLKTRNFRNLKKIEMIEVVSLPGETGFVKDPTVNVNNPSIMARMAEKKGKETVVVHGKHEHISFISDEKPTPLGVFDFVPPQPPKLIELVESALDAGKIQKPIKIVSNILDLNKLARASDKPFVMFPCQIDTRARANCGKDILSLIGAPDISSVGIDNIALIGCDVSLRTFKLIYGRTPTFINMCPLHRMELMERRGMKYLARCDKIAEGHICMGDTAYVSFDPKLHEVEEAILDLYKLEGIRGSSHKTVPELKFFLGTILNMLRRLSNR